jgi:hypothetical protein
MTKQRADEIRRKGFLAIRKEAGCKIDPETAEVLWNYAQTLDPYGVYGELPEEYRQVGREYFARPPGSDIWVWFGDLPDATRDRLWEKHKANLAFPAGLTEMIATAIDALNKEDPNHAIPTSILSDYEHVAKTLAGVPATIEVRIDCHK